MQQTAGRRTEELTDEEVPLRVQVGLVGEAALHHVLAVIPTRPQSRESAAVRAVQHLRQSFAAAWRNVDLEQRSNIERSISTYASHSGAGSGDQSTAALRLRRHSGAGEPLRADGGEQAEAEVLRERSAKCSGSPPRQPQPQPRRLFSVFVIPLSGLRSPRYTRSHAPRN
ncbi:hypothetical protein SRHO_G00189720 [Serrasalmus rhombeus]